MALYFSSDHKVHCSSALENHNPVTTRLPFQPNWLEKVHVQEIIEGNYGYIKYDNTTGTLYCSEIIENGDVDALEILICESGNGIWADTDNYNSHGLNGSIFSSDLTMVNQTDMSGIADIDVTVAKTYFINDELAESQLETITISKGNSDYFNTLYTDYQPGGGTLTVRFQSSGDITYEFNMSPGNDNTKYQGLEIVQIVGWY